MTQQLFLILYLQCLTITKDIMFNATGVKTHNFTYIEIKGICLLYDHRIILFRYFLDALSLSSGVFFLPPSI